MNNFLQAYLKYYKNYLHFIMEGKVKRENNAISVCKLKTASEKYVISLLSNH